MDEEDAILNVPEKIEKYDVEILEGTFKYTCPHCGQSMNFQDSMEYSDYTCPYCGGEITPVRERIVRQSVVVSEFKYRCPFCKTMLDIENSYEHVECKCPVCGNKIIPEKNVHVGVRVSKDNQVQSTNDYENEIGHAKNISPNSGNGNIVINNVVNSNSNIQIPPVSRLSYVLLALFVGLLGVHDFYAKRTGSGVAYLLVTFFSVIFAIVGVPFITFPIMWLCLILEMIFVNRDGLGRPMA